MANSLTKKFLCIFIRNHLWCCTWVLTTKSKYKRSFDWILNFGGEVFLKTIKMLVVPIVFSHLLMVWQIKKY